MARKKPIKPTVMKMALGFMRFRRRVDIPMWHVDHISKVANILREYADRIEASHSSNAMRASDKTMHCQSLIKSMNRDMGQITPRDPRERGAEKLRYTDFGLINEAGFDELQARDDMNE